MTTKGWTQNEAERRASWLHTAYPHSKMTARAVFDTVWDEGRHGGIPWRPHHHRP